MSDNFLLFISDDPHWQPSPSDADRAVSLLKLIAPGADSVEASFEDEVTFYHPVQNWSGVECSACGADAELWWESAMDAASANRFENLNIKTPCCGTNVSLNDLRYIWPAAFGRFALEARNPNIANTTSDQDQQLAECLGTRLRKVWMRI
ncbi:hypothetical protein QA648_24745 (plasmid) [Rhizobium sp. CB3171]|uniref:hypothetical protein n=1 Tax=Rhizobium sp. CB3171 TaxID=3039157 RepID=UPI0024B16683|nr:hypothetical protein [Rhizobium sp. CB3171]WFU06317.1 hypothetical protein QA648_24745 [Rhizobium sp. CB3171]